MATQGPRGTEGDRGDRGDCRRMFTAGNMTYMRRRKKERAAAKRAVARENVGPPILLHPAFVSFFDP